MAVNVREESMSLEPAHDSQVAGILGKATDPAM